MPSASLAVLSSLARTDVGGVHCTGLEMMGEEDVC